MYQAIHDSYWIQNQPLRRQFPRAKGELTTDVLVVGAGISGLSTALELAKRKRRVIVCEAEVIGAGTTAASTGHLDAHPEVGTVKLISQLGEEKARHYIRWRQLAIQVIKERADEAVDFQFLPAYHYSESEKDRESLQEDCRAATQIGLQSAWTDNIPIPRASCGYRIENMGRIHVAQYLDQLTDLAVQAGVSIFEDSLVTGDLDDDTRQLTAGDAVIHFDDVVFACHSNFTPVLHIYAATPAYQSYAMAVRLDDQLPDALYWDYSNPYFYTRRAASNDPSLWIIGGCDHRTGNGEELRSASRLEEWIKERFQIREVVKKWSAEFFEPTDGLPMIGKAIGDHVWLITGLSGVGLTQGTAAGELVASSIAGEEHALAELLKPSRSGLAKPLDWLKEQFTSVKDVAERVLPASVIDPTRLRPGQGAVGKIDGQHVAVCVDRNGCEHRLSPICQHMGGVVHWNEVEQTWDCPVHGGRYSACGDRIYGPPDGDLKPAPSDIEHDDEPQERSHLWRRDSRADRSS